MESRGSSVNKPCGNIVGTSESTHRPRQMLFSACWVLRNFAWPSSVGSLCFPNLSRERIPSHQNSFPTKNLHFRRGKANLDLFESNVWKTISPQGTRKVDFAEEFAKILARIPQRWVTRAFDWCCVSEKLTRGLQWSQESARCSCGLCVVVLLTADQKKGHAPKCTWRWVVVSRHRCVVDYCTALSKLTVSDLISALHASIWNSVQHSTALRAKPMKPRDRCQAMLCGRARRPIDAPPSQHLLRKLELPVDVDVQLALRRCPPTR